MQQCLTKLLMQAEFPHFPHTGVFPPCAWVQPNSFSVFCVFSVFVVCSHPHSSTHFPVTFILVLPLSYLFKSGKYSQICIFYSDLNYFSGQRVAKGLAVQLPIAKGAMALLIAIVCPVLRKPNHCLNLITRTG